jgi:hypothetical protein
MSIRFRALTPEDEKEAIKIMEKGYGVETLPHFRWKFMDNPSWKYDYSIVGESEGRIAAVVFLEPQRVKFLHKTIEVMVGGSGAVHEDFRQRGFYKAMTVSALDVAHRSGKKMFIAYTDKDAFTSRTLEKIGFYHFFTEEAYAKILSVKRTFEIAAEMLDVAGVDEGLSLAVKIVPDSENPFVLQLRKGKFSIEEDAQCDLEVSGNLKKMIALFIGDRQKKILPLIVKREVRIRFRITAMKRIIQFARFIL